MSGFDRLVENLIAKARAEGQLEGLPGEGQPLPDRIAKTSQEAADEAAYRIMAQAGVLPEEFELKKQLDEARAAVARETDPDKRKQAMARLADLDMRYNLARDARKSFMR